MMLNKFQEQDLMGSVEQLEVIKSISDNKKVNDHIDNVIILLKHINPTLFNYPKVAKYTSGKYESTLDWDREE